MRMNKPKPASDIKRQSRFVVYAPGIQSYLIKAFELSDQKLTIIMWVPIEHKIMDWVRHNSSITDPIRINTLNDGGESTEEVVFDNYHLLDWKVNCDWSDEDKPLELKFVYERNVKTKQVL